MLFVGTIVGSPIVSHFSDRIKKRTSLMKVGALLAMIVSLLIVMHRINSYIPLIVTFLMLGFIISTQALGYPTIVESNSKSVSSSATSVISTLLMLSAGIGQPLFGLIVSHYGRANELAG